MGGTPKLIDGSLHMDHQYVILLVFGILIRPLLLAFVILIGFPNKVRFLKIQSQNIDICSELLWERGHVVVSPAMAYKSNPWKTVTMIAHKNASIQPQIVRSYKNKEGKLLLATEAKVLCNRFCTYVYYTNQILG